MHELIEKYFPDLTNEQKELFRSLKPLYEDWNSKINVISRKDMEYFYLHHVLHSLAIARIVSFTGNSEILDVGTGGGFPGVPLAIMFPRCRFTLLDSIQKKIRVVEEVVKALGLVNVNTVRSRVEEHNGRYDFVISRAVTEFKGFVKMSSRRVTRGGSNTLRNGIIYLKGGDIESEIGDFGKRVRVFNISDFFEEEFFETKKIVYLEI